MVGFPTVLFCCYENFRFFKPWYGVLFYSKDGSTTTPNHYSGKDNKYALLAWMIEQNEFVSRGRLCV